jgi:hypothetical protein
MYGEKRRREEKEGEKEGEIETWLSTREFEKFV